MEYRTSISGIVGRTTATIFVSAIILASAGAYVFFRAEALSHVKDEAQVLMQAANAMRSYTLDNITPDLYSDEDFHPETVPSFAAQEIFRRLSIEKSDYTYREAALNPTNPNDLATSFEAELIQTFRQHDITELEGLTWEGDAPFFFLARPIRIVDPACLQCHSIPEAAPQAMVSKYGISGGYGWQLGKVEAVQLLTVPVELELRSVYELVALVFVMLLLLFLLVSVILSLPLQRNVVWPLRQLAEAAERASKRNDDVDIPMDGTAEILKLSKSITRLRASLLLALSQSDDPEK